jgi:hypothetical protein
MSMTNDGGPAFPRHALEIKLPDGSVVPKDPGMTLRDWFAGQALQGLLASTKTSDGLAIAKDAYILADAMLRARG